ncbi:TetR/AcrR family transcriptional regulator C-terminal domain-containing protein [Frankia sp. Ag45/Mut15]|uniref:TetR/AcrR family transcriptional regulator C-terminal domain-containing protein n=1 Tax=Frankia umida TaxID=573489 RepID=A0ABT0JRU3_9ACTN|nr:TetR/AcrR family transcriptional regulator C-terminal domain-containing protein [Frankia umida]MCK9874258.1 TetR/AcrR family transcriptional regulator C-terminal domain-containing protein [Frankia umida]
MDRPSSSRSRPAAGLPPMTADKIVDVALELTRASGLDGWSIRQLSAALEVWPGVIYHHVGDREAVLDAITNRVIALIPVPDPGLEWREWFRHLLRDGRGVLRQFRGLARRVVLMGPTVPAALPTIDRGIQVLQRAGFGADATLVYRFLLNTAFMMVAVEDDRDDRPESRGRMAEVLGDFQDDGPPGLAAASVDALARARDPRPAAVLDLEFYEFTVERALDGAASWLTALSRRP